jgi:hypothetical protein
MLAEKVETRRQFLTARDMGSVYFQVPAARGFKNKGNPRQPGELSAHAGSSFARGTGCPGTGKPHQD